MNVIKKRMIMKFTLSLLLVCLTASCNETDVRQVNEISIAGQYSDKIHSNLLDKAEMRAKELYKKNEDKDLYIHYFFKGYIHGLEDTGWTVHIGESEDPSQKGFDEGQMLYMKHLENGLLSLMLEEFGYEYLTVEGTYRANFEVSDFRPMGGSSKWWLTFKKGVLMKWRRDGNSKVDMKIPRQCQFRGYLAPDEGMGAGHFNLYDREFIVTEIVEIQH